MNELLAVTYFGGRVRMFFLLEIELKYVPSKLRRNRFSKIIAGRANSTKSANKTKMHYMETKIFVHAQVVFCS